MQVMHVTDTQSGNPFRCAAHRAWVIPAMVFGYIIWWPAGLALTFYMVFGDRWFREPYEQIRAWYEDHHAGRGTQWTHPGASRKSGNVAFDAYRDDVLERLEAERREFEAFLARLRAAKDKSEFDAFMEDQASRHAEGQSDDDPDEGPDTGLDDNSPVESR
jgi:hypothetical protein